MLQISTEFDAVQATVTGLTGDQSSVEYDVCKVVDFKFSIVYLGYERLIFPPINMN